MNFLSFLVFIQAITIVMTGIKLGELDNRLKKLEEKKSNPCDGYKHLYNLYDFKWTPCKKECAVYPGVICYRWEPCIAHRSYDKGGEK